MVYEEYIKQAAVFIGVNPAAGLISVGGSVMQNLIMSSKPVIVLAHEVNNINYTDSSGVPKDLNYLDITIQRSLPAQNIDDSLSFTPGSSASRILNLQHSFQYNASYLGYRVANFLIGPGQQINITFAMRFKALTVAGDYVSFGYRIFWKEL